MMISPKAINVLIFSAAYDYLVKHKPSDVEIERYFVAVLKGYKTLEEVFRRFIYSAQNYNRMPNIIAFKSREKGIAEILSDYDFRKVAEYTESDLYWEFRNKFGITSKDSKMNSWYKWSCSVIDSARFLSAFNNADELDKYISQFDSTVESRKELAFIIQSKIRGMGFALACDLIKELGYPYYTKPDVHMMDIFQELGLCEKTSNLQKNQIATFDAIERMAEDCKEIDPEITPYKVDKVFWLICSGHYYLEKPVLRVQGRKQELILYLKDRITGGVLRRMVDGMGNI